MEIRTSLIVLLIIFILFTVITTTQATDYPLTIIDDLNHKITINKEPLRIISLAPSNTEILFKLGLKDRVVGVTNSADFPEAATHIEKVGTITEPNIEKIIQLQPDLVIAAGITPMKFLDKLNELNIKVVGYYPSNLDQIINVISSIGKLTNKEIPANKITTTMKNRIKRITNKIKKNCNSKNKPKVFYEVWKDPLYTAGPDTFVDDLIKTAGGINIAHNTKSKWPQYSFEMLIAKNPDVYIASRHSWKQEVTKNSILKRKKFKDIKAIKKGRVYIIDPDLVNRAGPRIVDALEKIVRAIHPELFK